MKVLRTQIMELRTRRAREGETRNAKKIWLNMRWVCNFHSFIKKALRLGQERAREGRPEKNRWRWQKKTWECRKERKILFLADRAFLAFLFFKFRQFPSRLSRRCRWLSFSLLRRTDDDDYDCLIHLSVDSNCNKNDVETGVPFFAV